MCLRANDVMYLVRAERGARGVRGGGGPDGGVVGGGATAVRAGPSRVAALSL